MVLSHLQSIMLNITNIFPVKVCLTIHYINHIFLIKGCNSKCQRRSCDISQPWWHHETLPSLQVLCEGNPLVISAFFSHRSLMYSLLKAWTSSWTCRWIANDFKSYETHVISPWFPVDQDYALPITQNGFARWDPGHWFNILTGKELKMCSKIITPEHPIQIGIPQKTYNLLELT